MTAAFPVSDKKIGKKESECFEKAVKFIKTDGICRES